MKVLSIAGRFFLAIAVVAFGVQHLIYAGSGSGLGAPWTPEKSLLAYIAGAVFIVGGISLATGRLVRSAGLIMGTLFLLRALLYYAPKVAATPRDPGPWTSGFELLAMSGASLVLAGTLTTFQLGRILFAVSLVVFGIQHLMYGPFVAGLIPGWIPGHLFWAYFVGIAFIAAALAIVGGRLAILASTLLGTMFLLWVLILHAPRVAGALHNGDEWTSLFVALALSGGAFIIAGALRENS
jgi:uncharacterized membrane protein